jgi:hypothetical protein
MTDAYQVRKYGTDSSGRPIYLSVGLKAAFDEVCRRAKVTPTIIQGAYMAKVGGGAGASAGTHDEGACIDTRTWDLTTRQRRRLIRWGRRCGFQAVWFRNQRHGGFDEHCHWNYGGDKDATADARWQWFEYKAGRDGLASRGRDYHWRPDPIPTYPYAHWLDRKESQ